MKKLSCILCAVFFLVLSFNVNAQTSGADYFAGKWSVMVKGLPNGDTKMMVLLNKSDTTMAGAVQDSTGAEVAKITKADVTDSSVTVYFTAQGYDVNLMLMKKDEDHVTGNMMNMFDAEGERIKQ